MGSPRPPAADPRRNPAWPCLRGTTFHYCFPNGTIPNKIAGAQRCSRRTATSTISIVFPTLNLVGSCLTSVIQTALLRRHASSSLVHAWTQRCAHVSIPSTHILTDVIHLSVDRLLSPSPIAWYGPSAPTSLRRAKGDCTLAVATPEHMRGAPDPAVQRPPPLYTPSARRPSCTFAV